MGSVVSAPELSNTGSVAVAHGLSCSQAWGIFPDQGSSLCLLRWQAGSLPLSRQGVRFSLSSVLLYVQWNSRLRFTAYELPSWFRLGQELAIVLNLTPCWATWQVGKCWSCTPGCGVFLSQTLACMWKPFCIQCTWKPMLTSWSVHTGETLCCLFIKLPTAHLYFCCLEWMPVHSTWQLCHMETNSHQGSDIRNKADHICMKLTFCRHDL